MEDLAFSADGRYLATACADQLARVFDVVTGQEMAKLDHLAWALGIAFSPDGRLLLVTNGSGVAARLWDWRAAKLSCPPLLSSGQTTDGLFLPDTPWVVTKSDEAIRIWDTVLGKPLTPLLPLPHGGGCMRLGREGRQLAVFSGEYARVFDLSPLNDDNPHRLSLEQLRLLAELQSMHTTHEGGGVVRLTTAEWLERWHLLRQEQPDLFPWDRKR